MDAASEAYVEDVAAVLREGLGDALIGVYLHGSGTLGGFTPARSDVDLLAVSSRGLTDEEKSVLGRALSEHALSCPAVGLEFTLVTLHVSRNPTEEPPFEIHVTTRREEKVVYGEGLNGDTDLVMHFAVCRERGRAVLGPPPEEVFAPIPRGWLLRALADEMTWADEHAPPGYRVLNACRSCRYAVEGVIGSKVEGGEWARDRMSNPGLIEAALALQRGEAVDPPDRQGVDELVRQVRELLTVSSGT